MSNTTHVEKKLPSITLPYDRQKPSRGVTLERRKLQHKYNTGIQRYQTFNVLVKSNVLIVIERKIYTLTRFYFNSILYIENNNNINLLTLVSSPARRRKTLMSNPGSSLVLADSQPNDGNTNKS